MPARTGATLTGTGADPKRPDTNPARVVGTPNRHVGNRERAVGTPDIRVGKPIRHVGNPNLRVGKRVRHVGNGNRHVGKSIPRVGKPARTLLVLAHLDRPPTGSPKHTPIPMETSAPRRYRSTFLQQPVEVRLSVAENIPTNYAATADLRALLTPAGIGVPDITAIGALAAPARAADSAAAHARALADAAFARVDGSRRPGEPKGTDELLADAFRAVTDIVRPAARRDAALRGALPPRTPKKSGRRADYYKDVATYLGVVSNPPFRAGLAPRGLTDELLTADALADARAAHAEAVRLGAIGEDATRGRDALMVPLDEAVRDLQERAKGPLRLRPDLLALLGVHSRR